MLRGYESIRNSNSRRDPMTDEKPRCAATQASNSLASSSRTWFSTGIKSNLFSDDMVLLVVRKSILLLADYAGNALCQAAAVQFMVSQSFLGSTAGRKLIDCKFCQASGP